MFRVTGLYILLRRTSNRLWRYEVSQVYHYLDETLKFKHTIMLMSENELIYRIRVTRDTRSAHRTLKGALYRIWCGVNRLGDSGVNVV